MAEGDKSWARAGQDLTDSLARQPWQARGGGYAKAHPTSPAPAPVIVLETAQIVLEIVLETAQIVLEIVLETAQIVLETAQIVLETVQIVLETAEIVLETVLWALLGRFFESCSS